MYSGLDSLDMNLRIHNPENISRLHNLEIHFQILGLHNLEYVSGLSNLEIYSTLVCNTFLDCIIWNTFFSFRLHNPK